MFKPVIAIAAGALILAVAGCQSTPTSATQRSSEAPAAPGESPQALLRQAAAAGDARQARLYLAAAEGLLSQGDAPAAANALSAVDVDRLRPRETARFLLTQARVSIATGQLDQARSALLALDETQLPDPLQAALVNAELLKAEGRPADAAERLMGYTGNLDQATRQRVNDAIWDYLGKVPPFQALSMESRSAGTAHGWWQLKSLMFQSFTLADQRRRLDSWLRSNPNHPAAHPLPSALDVLQAPPPPVAHVALMLPLSGPLSRAGRAVRDAFLATYLSHRDDAGFEVHIYDTAAEPIATLYERALVEGAQVLIGPLSKDSVNALNQLNPEIPALALNYLPDDVTPAPNVLQLGLAIEDEAATLEQWLSDAHAQRVLAFHDNEDWSQRATRALASSWPHELDVQALENIRTVTESVGVAMDVAASRDRHDQMEKLLGEPLEFLPRARRDVDAIVALVTPLEATALVPALRFHYADQIPVYVTSQTVRGASRDRLEELDGFHVSELPWFAMKEQSYQNLDAAFGLEDSPFAALYALGVDAFRLADRTPLIVGGHLSELLGSTGELEFTPSGRIQRRLARAVIRDGTVRTAG